MKKRQKLISSAAELGDPMVATGGPNLEVPSLSLALTEGANSGVNKKKAFTASRIRRDRQIEVRGESSEDFEERDQEETL